MYWNIVMVVFGFIVNLIVIMYTADCYFNYKKSSGDEKKAWKRAFEGWAILLFFVVLNLMVDVSNLLSSITN